MALKYIRTEVPIILPGVGGIHKGTGEHLKSAGTTPPAGSVTRKLLLGKPSYAGVAISSTKVVGSLEAGLPQGNFQDARGVFISSIRSGGHPENCRCVHSRGP